MSINLFGGPAMRTKDYVQWREKWLVGASLTAVAPAGQYDSARLLNVGTNRWAFKPELGVTRRWRRWVAEGYLGVWLFTENDHFYPGNSIRTQRPITATEGHLGYYLRPRLWVSMDGNLWTGGRSTLNGIEKNDTQRESRAGVTMSVPFTRRQSVKFGYSQGAFKRIGGNFRTISAAWEYSWVGKPW